MMDDASMSRQEESLGPSLGEAEQASAVDGMSQTLPQLSNWRSGGNLFGVTEED